MEQITMAVTANWGFLDNLSEGVILLNDDGILVFVNEASRQYLQIFGFVNSLREICEQVGAGEKWSRWERLITNVPTHANVLTNFGYVDIQSKPMIWQDNPNLIMLIITPSEHYENLPESRSEEALYQHIENLRRENQQLMRRVSQVERLEILAEASNEISQSIDMHSILASLGNHMRQAVSGAGYTIYQWSADGQAVKILLNYRYHPEPLLERGETVTMYPVQARSVLNQLKDRNTMLMTQVSPYNQAYLLGKLIWQATADVHFNVILMPIFSSGEPFGFIALAVSQHQGDLDPNSLQLLATLMNQTVMALDKVRLFEETIEREHFLDSLGRVSLAINATLDQQTVLDLICQESRAIFNADGVYIWEKQENQLIGLAAEGQGQESFTQQQLALNTAEEYFTQHIIKAGESRFINQFRQHNTINIALAEPENIQAVLGIPLVREENILGVLVVVDRRNPHRFTVKDIYKANSFATQVAIALQNARLVTSLRTLNDELDQRVARRTKDLGAERDRFELLLRITTELSSTLEQEHILNRALELVNEVAQANQGIVMLIDEEGDIGQKGEFIFRAAFGMDRILGHMGQPSGLMRHEGLAGWIVENRCAVIVNDTSQDPRWVTRPESSEHRSVLAVPLEFSGEGIGVLMFFHSQTNAFTSQQLKLLEAAATQVSSAVYNAHLYNLIRNQAEKLGRMLREEQVSNAKMQAIL
ncbi:MAG: GAF domain-containing protein, partial [Anaerolineales bacterium]|nr:GAF domain-containing protein [Anaerolineales bacterium]